jgi:hypothetical protein
VTLNRQLVLATILLVASSLLTLPTQAVAATRPGGKLALESGAYWGMVTDYEGGIAAREAQLGRTMDIHHRFSGWTDHFPHEAQYDDLVHGRIPMVTWMPSGVRLADITAGVHDDNIAAHARAMRDFPAPIFLRFAHEMNGDWYSWGGAKNGGSAGGPAAYVSAWKHVHDIFTEVGASNVVWVWCVNLNDVPGASWNHWTNYYPGDTYVDWVGIDAYNWGTVNGGWRSMADMLGGSAYADYASRKPIMVAETAAGEAGGDKAQWIYDTGSVIKTAFPSVQAVVWFDAKGTNEDWAVDSSSAALDAYRSVGEDAYYGGTGIPDVVVTSVTWSPAAPAPGQAVSLSATIANRGSAPTPAGVMVGVGFFVDGVKTHWYGSSGNTALAPGQSRTVTANGGPSGTRFWPATFGSHTVQAVVDDARRFGESDESNNALSVPLVIPATPPGLTGSYYSGTMLSGASVVRTDATVDFAWGHGSPLTGVPADRFSVRWAGYVTAPTTGSFTFSVRSDDGTRLWVDNRLLIDDWRDHGPILIKGTPPLNLVAGQRYPLRLEYYDNLYSATVQLHWEGPAIGPQIIPAFALSH